MHTSGRDILTIAHLDLKEHRIGIIGANGSGKSTLVRLINGLTRPTSGTITVDGVDVTRHGAQVRSRVGFLFTDADNQIIMPTVAEDVAFSLRKQHLSRQEKQRRVTEALTSLGIDHLAEHSPHLLSGGEKQLLALASIRVLEPQLIIADEPTTLLDLRNRRRVYHILRNLSQQTISVSHDLDLIADADRLLCLDNGKIIDDSADPSYPSPTPQAVIDRYAGHQ